MLGNLQYVLSCPVGPQISHGPSLPPYPLLFPEGHLPPYLPHPTSPVPTTTLSPPHRTPVNEQTMQNQHHLSSGFQYLPQIFLPALQTPNPSKPNVDHFPQSMQQHFQYPSGSETLPYSFGSHLQNLAHSSDSKDHSEHQVFEMREHPSPYQYVLFYPYVPDYYQEAIPAAKEHSRPPEDSYYPLYYHQKPNRPVSTTPLSQAPASVPRPSSPEQPLNPQPQTSPFYPPMSYYHQQALAYSALHAAAAPPVGTPNTPKYPSSQSVIQTPFDFQLPPYLPPAKQDPENPVATYHMFYPAHYPKLHTPLPQYPTVASPTTAPDWLTPQMSHIQCLKDNIAAFLPFADPESVHVRGQYCVDKRLFLELCMICIPA